MGRKASLLQLVCLKIRTAMERIENIVRRYRQHRTACDRRRREIDDEIERFQEERKRLDELHWTEGLLRPVMREIARLTPEIDWKLDETFHPRRLRCAVSVFGRLKDGGQLVCITFTELGGELYFDAERTESRFVPGTLGAMNGMNTLSVSVGDGEPLLRYLRQQVLRAGRKPAF